MGSEELERAVSPLETSLDEKLRTVGPWHRHEMTRISSQLGVYVTRSRSFEGGSPAVMFVMYGLIDQVNSLYNVRMWRTRLQELLHNILV